jgi:hypothetical protein
LPNKVLREEDKRTAIGESPPVTHHRRTAALENWIRFHFFIAKPVATLCQTVGHRQNLANFFILSARLFVGQLSVELRSALPCPRFKGPVGRLSTPPRPLALPGASSPASGARSANGVRLSPFDSPPRGLSSPTIPASRNFRRVQFLRLRIPTHFPRKLKRRAAQLSKSSPDPPFSTKSGS